MKQVKNKLRSQRGVTILMALLFLLICAMVGAAVLASASANADKNTGRLQEQEAYQALASAIRLLENTMDGKSCVGSEFQIKRDCYRKAEIVGAWHEDEAGKTDMKMDPADGQLQDYLVTEANKIFLTQTVFHEATTGDYSNGITMEMDIEAEGMLAVKLALTMRANYDLYCVLTVPDTKYEAILEFPCELKLETAQENADCMHQVTFPDPDDPDKTNTYDQGYEGEKNIRTTTLIWSAGKVTKGGATA